VVTKTVDTLQLLTYTVACIGVILPIAVLMIQVIRGEFNIITLSVTVIIEIVIVFIVCTLIPIKTYLEENSIVVKSILSKKKICNVEDVKHVEQVSKMPLRLLVSRDYKVYTCKSRNVIVLHTNRGKIVIHPGHESLIHELRRRISGSSTL